MYVDSVNYSKFFVTFCDSTKKLSLVPAVSERNLGHQVPRSSSETVGHELSHEPTQRHLLSSTLESNTGKHLTAISLLKDFYLQDSL